MNDIKTILLVEDNPQDAELTIEALKQKNLANNIFSVCDGVEALEYLLCEGKFAEREKINPAVILLDIKMPRMDGIEVLQFIRNNERFKSIPVVMLTSSREEPDLLKCYSLGVNAFVVKPVGFKEFFDAVQQIGLFWAVLNERPLSNQ